MDTGNVTAIKDPEERARAANKLIDEYQAAIAELSDVRRETLRELLASGMSQMAIADMLGMSKSRISQLLSAGTRPELTFLGTGKVTVAVGGNGEGRPHICLGIDLYWVVLATDMDPCWSRFRSWVSCVHYARVGAKKIYREY